MTSFFIREAQPAGKELTNAGLASVVKCKVCSGFTKRTLIQLHELAKSCQSCPGCYFLQGIIVILTRAGFNIPVGAWTPFILTSWTLWGTEHFLTIARCERQTVDHWQVPTILEEADFIEVFKRPGEKCPWAKVPTANLISCDTGSEACMDSLRSRLDECAQKHRACRDNSAVELPARVLEISAVEGDELAVRLVETNGKVGKYICLSHRWIAGQTITTTTSNIEERRAGISWNELPKTYQEAITVTHTLGFEYIWIDSLAINQDHSSGDWLLEAPKMADYYQKSSLTISAAEATEGLFYRLPDTAQVGWKVMPPVQFNQPSYNIYIRKPLSHDISALHHRGWVFQEHILSPRIAHFGKELIWECAELTACECGRFPLSTKGGQAPLRDIWDIGNVVNTYGRKQGHMMALSFACPNSWFSIIPQPVFVKPDLASNKSGLEISHWILMQKQHGDVERNIDRFASSPEDVMVMIEGSQSQDDEIGELAGRMVLLQTAGIQKENSEKKKTTPSPRSTEIGEDHDQDTAENGGTGPAGPLEDEGEKKVDNEDKEEICVSPPTPLTHSRWLDIIAHYTRRELTYGSDILPALAGLAKQCQPIFDCGYYAGLWEDTFPIDLLWRSRNPRKYPKLTEWRAPSWSWASTAAPVDYYHLLMAFELDSHTFRYSVSHLFVDDIQVNCVPSDGNDMTMRLQSAKVTLQGVIFELTLAPMQDNPQEETKTKPEMTAEQIESMRGVMEQAVYLPNLSTPEDDIRYFPLARCLDSAEEVSWLASDTGLSFLSKKNEKKEFRAVLDMWWDHQEAADADAAASASGMMRTYDCLLVARHESTVDTAFFSLLLKQTQEPDTYERIGLLRHEGMADGAIPTVLTIV